MLAAPIFTHNLNQNILPGLVTLGRYSGRDGVASITVTTPSNKILIYDADKLGSRTTDPAHSLNIAQPVTAIGAVRFDNDDVDSLVVCTKTTVYVYNVDKNADVFTRGIVDGANAMAHQPEPGVLFVGGNCSVQGLDKRGDEVFWVVTGDNVRCLTLADVDGDGRDELVVGSDDYDVRIFKGDDLVHEITETQIVTHLHSLGNGLFGYALANGTVGVYEKLNRIWRVKSKNRATCLASYDVNGDGQIELVTGWRGGKVDGRDVKTGEVLFKDNLDQTVAGVCVGECRESGRRDLIVVSITGQIRCYNPKAPKSLVTRPGEMTCEEETIRDLLTRKQALMLEMKKYEAGGRTNHTTADHDHDSRDGAIPARTRLQTSLGVSLGSTSQVPHVEVSLSTNNDTVIRAVIIFAEGIFKDETHVKHPRQSEVSGRLNISLYPPRDVPIDIHIKAFIGYPDSGQFHVFELTRQLPRFAMYTLVDKPSGEIVSNVVFFVNERIQRVILWINRNFLLAKPLDSNTYSELSLHFLSLRDGKDFGFHMDPSGKVTIQTDNIVLAGDLIQSLASYLNLDQLKSVAHYPREEESCADLLDRLRDLETTKQRLNVDLSNKSSLIRSLIVRGEDARLLNDLKLMKRFYAELNALNEELRAGYEIRVNNYNDIVTAVKELNGLVQKASRLRVGKSKTDPVSLAKAAISSNNSSALIKVIRTGDV